MTLSTRCRRYVTLWMMAGLLAVAPLVRAQSTPGRLSFEVASIRPNTSGSGEHNSSSNADQLVITNWPLRRFIVRAYNVQPKQIAGADSLDRLFFDMTAKYAPGARADERALMLRSLLEDRFGFRFHRETKEMTAYALVVAKGGLKVKPAETSGNSGMDSDSGTGGVRTLRVTAMSMADLANGLANNLGDVVVDQSGVAGLYSFELRYTLEDQSAGGAEAVPSLFTALEETVGLRLQRQKVPVSMVVVDHIASVPTEN